jgi:3-methylcrotonyl-CoA carboxylase alpha subunit
MAAPMFESILIANRGEIACRIIRTARRLGVKTVAVYSDADFDAPHVALADEAHHIGPAAPAESYLAGERILDAAALAAVDAIHPGYGFLSENPDFAEAVRRADFVFVGPPADAIRAMGSKSEAKAIMEASGVPVIPGYHGADQELTVFAAAAEKVGYPVLVKAVAGGGGRGMRIVEDARGLAAAIEQAGREARAAFGDGRLLLEKYVAAPRHVEVQVFGDRFGDAVHLFERDCSIQRRHQKIVEEAPAFGLDPDLRRRMGAAAVRAATAVGYEGAGTVEFLLDPGGAFYFMEMNTRLQVEHPVTEMITGFDLVEWQLRIASGERLPADQDAIRATGHAIEVRLYAEDPARDFLPASGRLLRFRFPEEGLHLRIDTGVREGDVVGTFYDPLIAKLVVWDQDRRRTVMRLRRALEQVYLAGVANNVAFLAALAGHQAFAAGEIDTGFVDRHRRALLPGGRPAGARSLALACLFLLKRREREAAEAAKASADPHSPWHRTDGWRLNDDNYHVFWFRDGEETLEATVHYRKHGWFAFDLPGGARAVRVRGEFDDEGNLDAEIDGVRMVASVVCRGDELTVIAGGSSRRLVVDDPVARAERVEARAPSLAAPMPGRIIAVHAVDGERVARGRTLVVVEAMKMEHAVTAPYDGIVARVRFGVGDQVQEGDVLVEFEDVQPAAAAGGDSDHPAAVGA